MPVRSLASNVTFGLKTQSSSTGIRFASKTILLSLTLLMLEDERICSECRKVLHLSAQMVSR